MGVGWGVGWRGGCWGGCGGGEGEGIYGFHLLQGELGRGGMYDTENHSERATFFWLLKVSYSGYTGGINERNCRRFTSASYVIQ